jgi:hypothetical protein
VRLCVYILEKTSQAKDEGERSFEVPSAREKVEEVEEPKARGEEDLQSQGLIELRKYMVHRESLSKDMPLNQRGNIYGYVV